VTHAGPSVQNYVTPWCHVREPEADTFLCRFALDAAADRFNAKAPRFYTKRDNGKKRRWYDPTFYNCEYWEQGDWLDVANFWARKGIRSAGLLRLATSESYWPELAYNAGTIDLYKGRIAFLAPRGGLRLITKKGVRFIAAGEPIKGSSFANALVLLGPGFAPRVTRYRDAKTGRLLHFHQQQQRKAA
jgi:hypothetical protein